MHRDGPAITRRRMLLAATGTAVSTAGCLNRLRRTADREDPSQVSINILSLPDDEDTHSIRVANHLANNLSDAGLDVDVIPTRQEEFLRRILLNHNYDLYVWRLPPQSDPDFLRTLLHSRFAEEPGWQNPFSYSNSLMDELLDEQRHQTGAMRAETIKQIQLHVHEERPLVPILFERDYRLSRPERIAIPSVPEVGEATWLLGLRRAADSEDNITCRLGTTDRRLTDNLNPIAVEYRGGKGISEFIYEAPARFWGTNLVPWLAEHWEWTSPTGASRPTLEMRMRPDLLWHDDESLTADDVVFTYQFLLDTTMSDGDPTIPAPRYRGRTTLLDSIEAIDEETVLIQFEESTRQVAREALTIPILPEHIWEEHTDLTDVAGITIAEGITNALVIDNLDPVGSGPFRVSNVETQEELELVRDDNHFIWDEPHGEDSAWRIGAPDFDRIVIDVRPSVSNIAESIRSGGLDGAYRNLGRRIVEEEPGDAEQHTAQTSWLFHVGFNLREFPLTVHGFRNAIAHLIDRNYILDEIFSGAGKPVMSPVFADDFVPQELMWDESDPDVFAGDPGSGDVDPEVARDHFRDAGFQYSEDGDLLARQPD